MKQRTVIYHANCVDGFTAAWAAWKKFGDEDTEYVPALYGQPPPDVAGREVLIVDFSYPRDVLLAMAPMIAGDIPPLNVLISAGADPKIAAAIVDPTLLRAKSLRVLDHHASAQKDLEGLDFCEFDMNRSGAGMTWDAIQSEGRPWLVNYVEDRDLWRFKLPNSKEVNAAIGMIPRESFEDFDRYFRDFTAGEFADRGHYILAAQDQYVEKVCQEARKIEFDGSQISIVNCSYVHMSEIVGKLAEQSPHGWAIGWLQRADGKFALSLRSRGNGPDVSRIAKIFGGGGHKGAAGFTLPDASFLTRGHLEP